MLSLFFTLFLARADETQAIYKAVDYVLSLGDDPVCRMSTNERACLVRRASVRQESPFYVVTIRDQRCSFTVYVDQGSIQVNPGPGSATWSCRGRGRP